MATITHLNPDTMLRNAEFSQAVAVEGASKLVFVGGQNGVTADGRIVGADLRSQTRQALRNVLEVLRAAGATQEQVVRMTIYIAAGQDIREGYAASQEVWGAHPTAISVLVVAGLGVPGALVEIEATAAL